MREQKRKEEAKMSLDEYRKQQEALQESEKLDARKVEEIDMKGLKVVAKDEVRSIPVVAKSPTVAHAYQI